MQRIDDPSNVPTVPAPLPTVSPGFFRRPSILAGDQGTILTGDWANDVQESLAQAITAAGIALVKGTGTQLRDAINVLAAALITTHNAAATESVAGHARFATLAEALAGTLGTAFLSPLRLKESFDASFANPGFLQIRTNAGLWIANFGIQTVNNSSNQSVTFARAFPTGPSAHFITPNLVSGQYGVTGAFGAENGGNPLTQVLLRNSTSQNVAMSWISLGH